MIENGPGKILLATKNEILGLCMGCGGTVLKSEAQTAVQGLVLHNRKSCADAYILRQGTPKRR